VTLREERRVRVFENRPKRDEITGEWWRHHDREITTCTTHKILIE
jgi:hypothetical protein